MKFVGIVILLFSFHRLTFGQTFGLKFQDIVPIKHDVIKVRYESEIALYPDRIAVLDFIGMVEKNSGYTAEEYGITTPDGYNLILHRISGSPSSPKRRGKPVIFLQHGIIMSSDCWVLMGPGKDLAYLLSDAGYDVWLGNFRGNTYSRSHVTLKPNDKQFWDYSWHEHGTIDLPAFIDKVLEVTGEAQLIYIGYSMGTTSNYVLLSELPEYNNKIRLVVSIAPIAFWSNKNLPSLLRFGVDRYDTLQVSIEQYAFYEILPQSSLLVNLAKVVCSNNYKNSICSKVIETVIPILNLDSAEFSYVELFQHFPAGTSAKTVFHYVQNAAAEEFQDYDYGIAKNLERYSQKKPPPYNLTRITAPVALFWGPDDYFRPSEKNVGILKSKLPNVVLDERINRDTFNHFDFILAKDVKELVFNKMISFINNFNNQ